jgi:hypothetical protein
VRATPLPPKATLSIVASIVEPFLISFVIGKLVPLICCEISEL